MAEEIQLLLNLQQLAVNFLIIIIIQQVAKLMDSTISLRQFQTQRINHLIINFAKTQPNVLKYSQVLMMMLDRCIFSNKFTLGDFHRHFIKIYESRKEQNVLQEEKTITKDQLIILFSEIGKALFKSDTNYLNRFYNVFLSQKVDQQNGQVNHSRVLISDATNLRIITQSCIKTISLYQQELMNIFIAYLFQNYWSFKKSKRILLTLRQIILQNKKWSYVSLIHFLKQSQTTPHLLSVQNIEETLRLIIPSVNNKQQQFYSRHILSDGYHKQIQNNQNTFHAGDPGIMFFQFQLLISRMAFDSFPKQLEKKSMSDILQRYFGYLFLRKNQEINTKQFPKFNRKMLALMKQYYKIMDMQNSKQTVKEQVIDKSTPFQKLAQRMNSQIINAQSLGLDFIDSFKILDKQLPKLPPAPVVTQEMPPPYKRQIAITLGQQPPPEPPENDDKVKVQKKKQGGKKDQVPQREFKWADVPETKFSGEDYLKQIETKLNFQVKPLSSVQRGVIKRQSFPVIISQSLFPPELPKDVAPYILAASNAMTDRNFILAIQNYNKGMSVWKNTNVQFDSVAELFFQYCKGNVYLSVGKYEYALQQFFNCRKFSDTSKLAFSNPDRSLPYFGLGDLFYEMEQYQVASRCFLKARQIRQSVLGLEHVQTATVFNNLGCCFYMIGRSQQALAYIQLAEAILDTQLGQHHERTMTSRNNLKLISHGAFQNVPQYRKFWQVFEEDKFQKKKKKKQKQGKKK